MWWSASRRFPPGRTESRRGPLRIVKIAIENKKVQPFLTASPDEMRKTVTLKTTLGDIRIRLEPDWGAQSRPQLPDAHGDGWYNGTPFHRVVKDFVVQGGTRNTPHPADRWVHPVKGEFRERRETRCAALFQWRERKILTRRRRLSF